MVTASSISGNLDPYGLPKQQPLPPVTPLEQPSGVQSSQDWLGHPKRKMATTTDPVITRSAPAPTSMTPPVTDIDSRGDSQIKDYVAWAELNTDKLSQEDQFKLKRSQQILQDRAFQQSSIDPYTTQITQEQQLRQQREAELKQRDQSLAEARRRELELTYGKRITGEKEAGQKTMDAAQGVLSFSGFGRSTYAAEKQAEIQSVVNENINILNAERDSAMMRYEAELRGATAEELAGYDETIRNLRQKSAEFAADLALQMNEYNMQTAASYEERINNVIQLAQSLEVVELTPGQQAEAEAYATLLIDREGKVNDKLLTEIPPNMRGYALRKAAEIKSSIPERVEAPETIKADDGSIYAFNEETGEFEKVIGGKPLQSDKTVTVEDEDGNKIIMQFNPATGRYDLPVTPSGFTSNGTPLNEAIKMAIDKNKTGAQCGRFVNDILQEMGMPRLIGDSYASKEMAISQIGIAISPQDIGAGSIFAYPVKSHGFGHIGIVTAVNADGTIDIMDYNYKGDEQRRERNGVDPSEISAMGGMISKPIIRDDTVDTGPQLTDTDYSKFNNTTFKPQSIKGKTEKAKYEAYLAERNAIFSDPDATAEDIFRVSLGGGNMTDTAMQKLDKFNTVLSSLGDIQKQIGKTKATGPILGILGSNNPYDTQAQALKSHLISIIPNLARGVYGEVGVLTDNDVRLYQQTIPNLRQTKDVQNAVLAMTLKTVQRGMENSLKTQARNGKDVSAFIGELKSIQSQVEQIERSIGIGQQQGSSIAPAVDNKAFDDLRNNL